MRFALLNPDTSWAFAMMASSSAPLRPNLCCWKIAGDFAEAITIYHSTLVYIEINKTIRTRTRNEYHFKRILISAGIVDKRGGIIRILLLEVRRYGIVGDRDNVPPEKAG